LQHDLSFTAPSPGKSSKRKHFPSRKFLLVTPNVQKSCFPPIGVARGAKRTTPPQMSSISCHFVLCEAASQTKHCCSLKVERFDPPKMLGWLLHRSRLSFTLTAKRTNGEIPFQNSRVLNTVEMQHYEMLRGDPERTSRPSNWEALYEVVLSLSSEREQSHL